ncbi:MAG: STAS domain-containing protein [Gammaproteobacteria bacterium]
MAAKEQQNLIGFDPLAWVSDEERNQVSKELENSTTTASTEQEDTGAVEITARETTSGQDVKVGALVLDEVLNIQSVGRLYERLLKLFEVNNKIEIDVSEVKVIDTATLQLLIVLKQESVKLGKEIVFDFPSERFVEAAQLLGLDALLGVDQPESGLF